MAENFVIRPLRRGASTGHWKSRDGRWTFLRHFSDPHPQRWFAYLDDDEYPCNEGDAHTTLMQAADFAEQWHE